MNKSNQNENSNISNNSEVEFLKVTTEDPKTYEKWRYDEAQQTWQAGAYTFSFLTTANHQLVYKTEENIFLVVHTKTNVFDVPSFLARLKILPKKMANEFIDYLSDEEEEEDASSKFCTAQNIALLSKPIPAIIQDRKLVETPELDHVANSFFFHPALDRVKERQLQKEGWISLSFLQGGWFHFDQNKNPGKGIDSFPPQPSPELFAFFGKGI